MAARLCRDCLQVRWPPTSWRFGSLHAVAKRSTNRHRLNRGGNRQANAALYRIVVLRMRYHQPTKAYVVQRTSEGESKREIIRCLKRYVAREIYTLLTQADEQKHAHAA
jgi:hypothetical protein